MCHTICLNERLFEEYEMTFYDSLLCMVHECVHVAQYRSHGATEDHNTSVSLFLSCTACVGLSHRWSVDADI